MTGGAERQTSSIRGSSSPCERVDVPHGAESGDDFFVVLSNILSYMASAVDVLHAAGDEEKTKGPPDGTQWKRPQLSAVSKRRLLARTISNLQKGIQEVSMLKLAGEELQEHYMASKVQQSAAEKSRQEVYTQLHQVSGSMHETSLKLQKAEEARAAAGRERDAMQETVDSLARELDTLRGSLHERDEQVADITRALQELQERQTTAQQERQDAVQDKAAAVAAAQEAERCAAAAQESLQKCKLTATRNQEAVAKLTADNLMLVMKLAKAEKEAAQLTQERDMLKDGLEKQEGPWFDKVKLGVEQQVKYAMSRADELEAELEQERRRHAEQLAQESATCHDLRAKLSASVERGDALQRAVEQGQHDTERLNLKLTHADDEIQTLRTTAENAQAEVRVLRESMQEMRHECQDAAMRMQEAAASELAATSMLSSVQAGLEAHKAQATKLQSALDAQLQVNKELMARKSDIEWQLMTALASDPGSAATAPAAST